MFLRQAARLLVEETIDTYAGRFVATLTNRCTCNPSCKCVIMIMHFFSKPAGFPGVATH